jgi:MoaA/NifB/PqqE/SkfB family radical SAM enzyme
MYKLEDIRDIHIEITSKCQARCPMCPRRVNGGILNPLISLNEITLEQFKEWIPVYLIEQLDSLIMCGNLGDPIIAEDCLEIFQYLRQINPCMQLSMHTNGSARNVQWWRDLAVCKVKVTFGIDGLEDTHHLYRVNTDWHRIMKNAWSFIDAGGEAEWHMLVFKHNEHQVEECRTIASDMKFKHFQVKHTSRFVDGKFNVLNEAGKTTHILYPTDLSGKMIPLVQTNLQSVKINCKAVKRKQIYIAADGTVSPCCWLDFGWILPKQDSRIDYMDTIGSLPNLNNQSLYDIFSSKYFEQIENTWLDRPLLECSKQCGSFDKAGAQFVN